MIMKQYLITGGTGMVGSQLVNEIKKSDSHITILTRHDQISNDKKIYMSTGLNLGGNTKFLKISMRSST